MAIIASTMKEPMKGVEAEILTILMMIMEKHQEANVDKIIALIDVMVANVAPKNAMIQLAIVEED
jgi:anti-sigma factor ChrR (cupin superfamily)